MSTDVTDPPRDLIVDAKPAPGDASSGSGSGMAPIVIPAIVAGFLAKYVNLSGAVVVLGLAIAFHVLRQKPDLGRFVLRVEERSLVVLRERSEDTIARVAIDDIVDIHAATVTIAWERWRREGADACPGKPRVRARVAC